MRTLLLADDNVTVQRVIALTFAKEPVRVVTASDGHQAMDRMVVERPDIVLAGTTLPQVNGYELARFARSKAELKDVPVLLLSGAFETVDEAQLKSSGAAGVIEKPVEPTTVISRVKELLGLKAAGDPAPVGGRLVTPSAVTPAPHTAPVTTAPAAQSEQPEAEPIDALESAFDTLDDQMAGHQSTAQRNPPPPLGQTKAARDPRSPGRPPAPNQAAEGGNPVYEVDEAWFGDGASQPPRDDSHREIAEELRAPELAGAGRADDATPVYEVDDEWFAEDQKAREGRELEQKQLAAEMGIHEVELPAAVEPSKRVERVEPVEPVEPVERVEPVEPVELVEPVPDFEPEPIARSLPIDWFPRSERKREPAPVAKEPDPPVIEVSHEVSTPIAEFETPLRDPGPMTSETPGRVADDFAQLLAFEQGEHARPPMIEPVIHAVTPEITPEMLEQIASTVADRLRDNLRVEPQAPEITGEMLDQIASVVAAKLHIEPKAPEVTGEMIKTMAYLVSSDVRNHIRIDPVPPVITPEMIYQISEMVATQLRDAIRVEPKAPEMTEAMLNHIAASVAYLLRENVQVEARAPEITDEMLGRIAENVAGRLKDSIRVEAAIPELNAAMLDQIAGTVTTRLMETVEGSVAGSVQGIISTMKDHVAEAVRASAVPPELTNEMLDHMAWTVVDRLQTAMPAPAPPAAPVISEEMMNLVAARVAERVQSNFSIDSLKDAITASIRDTVRTVVAETSERLVREEIDRIKSKAQ
ncbi:MAG TPA: response regulator [Vicinamibacterales bacterium]|nr:response regulator [Vicinamibacterales bacterium]